MKDDNEISKMQKYFYASIDLIIAIVLIFIVVILLGGCSLLRTEPPEFQKPESKLFNLVEKEKLELEIYSLSAYPPAKILSTENESYAAFDQKGFHSLMQLRVESEANRDSLIYLKDLYNNSIDERNGLLTLAKDFEERSYIYQEKANNADFYLMQQKKYATIRQWAERGIFALILAAILL